MDSFGRPLSWPHQPPIFLSDDAFTLLKALYEYDPEAERKGYYGEKRALNASTAPCYLDGWWRALEHTSPFPGRRKSRAWFAFHDLHMAGLATEFGYSGWEITDSGREWYEAAASKARFVAY